MLQNLKGLVERKACEVSKATKDMKELKKKWERVQRSNFLVSLNCVIAWERDELRLEMSDEERSQVCIDDRQRKRLR
jgi:hypothetical protein